jgi:KUP system potassium uptake protein
METWEQGRGLVAKALRNDGLDLKTFVEGIDKENIARAKRTAIYAVGNIDTVPQALLHNLRHNEVLHQRNIILTVIFKEIPYVKESDRIEIEKLSNTFWRVRLNFGFLNTPDVPKNLALVSIEGTQLTPFEITYFLSRQTVIPTHDGAMSWWRENLFATMHRNAGSVAEYFRLPENAVVELGTHVQI